MLPETGNVLYGLCGTADGRIEYGVADDCRRLSECAGGNSMADDSRHDSCHCSCIPEHCAALLLRNPCRAGTVSAIIINGTGIRIYGYKGAAVEIDVIAVGLFRAVGAEDRSEEHTSELQSPR